MGCGRQLGLGAVAAGAAVGASAGWLGGQAHSRHRDSAKAGTLLPGSLLRLSEVLGSCPWPPSCVLSLPRGASGAVGAPSALPAGTEAPRMRSEVSPTAWVGF